MKPRANKATLTAFPVLCLLAVGFVTVAADSLQATAPAVKKAAAQQTGLKRGEAKRVCMIHDEAFAKDMLPVVVSGRTYYAFCDRCKAQLTRDAEARVAVDAVSGKKVDKAKAVIGVKPDGKVLYFENTKNFETYKAKGAKD